MKKHKSLVFLAAVFLSLTSLIVFAGRHAFADIRTWDGGGGDNNFSTAENWSGDVAPANGDKLVIPYDVVFSGGCNSNVTLNNDLDPGSITLSGITFTDTGEMQYCNYTVIIGGNNLSVSGDILGNDANTRSPRAQLSVNVTATSALTIQSIDSTGSLAIGSNSVTVLSSTFSGGGSGSGALTLDSYPTGSGGAICESTATPSPISGNSSSFSGSIKTQSDGTIAITGRTTDIARYASSITKESTGTLGFLLDYGQNMSLNRNMTFKGGTAYASQNSSDGCVAPTINKTVTLSGNITFTANTTFSLNRANIKFTGNLTGKQYVKVASGGTGTITFPDNTQIGSSTEGHTIDSVDDCENFSPDANNLTIINVDCSSVIGTNANDPVEFFGTIGGIGRVGHIKIMSGGSIAPGKSPGCFTTGNLTFQSGGVYSFELGGATACSGYDQIRVVGTTTLANGTLDLDLYHNFKPSAGQTYKIIDNDGSDAVSGTFKNLGEGATFSVSGYVYKITYKGGTGNDVVLSVISIPEVPDTGYSQILNNRLAVLVIINISAFGSMILTFYYVKLVKKNKG